MYRIVVSILVVHRRDSTAAWELRLTDHNSLLCISWAWENIKIQNSKDSFYWMHIAFTPLLSQKILSWTHCKLGTICIIISIIIIISTKGAAEWWRKTSVALSGTITHSDNSGINMVLDFPPFPGSLLSSQIAAKPLQPDLIQDLHLEKCSLRYPPKLCAFQTYKNFWEVSRPMNILGSASIMWAVLTKTWGPVALGGKTPVSRWLWKIEADGKWKVR